MNITEWCPHCEIENDLEVSDTFETQMTTVCKGCGKVIDLCDKCAGLTGEDGRNCDKCPFCDLANFMNYLRGNATIEQLLSSLSPALTDMTTGLPDGVVPTLEDYLNDAYGDEVQWDVKYWDIYRMVKECFLNSESSEEDCRNFVETLITKNRE